MTPETKRLLSSLSVLAACCPLVGLGALGAIACKDVTVATTKIGPNAPTRPSASVPARPARERRPMDPSSVCARTEPDPATVASCLALREQDPGLLAQVARHFAESGHTARAAELLDEALSMCERPSSLPGIGGRENVIAFALAEIAATRAKLGNTAEATRIADRIDTGLDSPYGALAKAQAQGGIAVELAKAGQFERALELAKRIRACSWITVRRFRQCVPDNTDQIRALTEISRRLAKVRELDMARQAVQAVIDPIQRRRSLVALSLVFAQQAELETAVSLLGEASSGAEDDPSLLVELAGAWRQLGKEALGRKYLDQAMRRAESHASDAAYGWFEIEVAEECYAAGLQDRAATLLDRAFTVVKAAQYEAVREQLELLKAISGATARGGRFDRAREMARAIGDEDYGNEALAQVVKAYADAGQLERAFALAQTIAYPDHRAHALCTAAGAYSAAGKRDQTAAALNLALAALPKSDNRVLLLLEIDTRYREARLAPGTPAQQRLRELVRTSP